MSYPATLYPPPPPFKDQFYSYDTLPPVRLSFNKLWAYNMYLVNSRSLSEASQSCSTMVKYTFTIRNGLMEMPPDGVTRTTRLPESKGRLATLLLLRLGCPPRPHWNTPDLIPTLPLPDGLVPTRWRTTSIVLLHETQQPSPIASVQTPSTTFLKMSTTTISEEDHPE